MQAVTPAAVHKLASVTLAAPICLSLSVAQHTPRPLTAPHVFGWLHIHVHIHTRRSSGGVNGWAEDEEVRALVGADGACDCERDMILGWFHVGASDKGAMYKARRGPIESKVTWIGEE